MQKQCPSPTNKYQTSVPPAAGSPLCLMRLVRAWKSLVRVRANALAIFAGTFRSIIQFFQENARLCLQVSHGIFFHSKLPK
jgi:hypothetical protein